MGEGVVADLVAFVVDPSRQRRVVFRLESNEEESRRDMLGLENVKDLGSPFGIRAVVKCDRDLFGSRSIARDPIRFRQGLEDLVGDETARIEGDFALAIGWPSLDAQDLALPLHVDV